MKTTHRCPKCRHDRILYIATVADRTESTHTQTHSVPMRVAHYERSAGKLFGLALTTSESAGELEAGVCPRCGFTELYTKDPGSIVVDGVNVRELVAQPQPAGPH